MVLLLLCLVMAGCAGGGSAQTAPPAASPSAPAAPASPPPSTAPAAVAPATAAPATPVAPEEEACPATQAGVDAADFQGPLTGDVDGDGSPDEVYVDGLGPDGRMPRLAVRTATGAVSDLEVAGRDPEYVGVHGLEDIDGDGREEIFVAASTVAGNGVGSQPVVQVAVFQDCRLTMVTNDQGAAYQFLVDSGDVNEEGDPPARGVGCVDVDGDGARDLVGLTLTERPEGGHDYQRTVVEIDGTAASNGATDSGSSDSPPPPAVSCGEDTFEDPLYPDVDQ